MYSPNYFFALLQGLERTNPPILVVWLPLDLQYPQLSQKHRIIVIVQSTQ